MQFQIYRSNGSYYLWRLVGDDGVALAVSSAEFASEQAAQESADAVREHFGTPEPAR